MDMTNELKPGTRVWLTGWSQVDISDQTKAFLTQEFPIEAVFVLKSYPEHSPFCHFQISENDSWHYSLFTYEILTDNNEIF